ncbi:MAG: ADOP family duplicated permease [Gemmatimonas sp.]
MRILDAFLFRLRSMLGRDSLNADFDDELRYHIERETQENIKRGMAPDEARRAAHAAFGGVERFKEGLRDEHGVRWLDDLSADIRHGFRLLRKNTLFSATVIATLGLGIGATTTIFTIVNGVLLRPLPFANADRIVSLSESTKGKDGNGVGDVAFNAWMRQSRSFSSIAVYGGAIATLTGEGEPVEIKGGAGTPAFFTALQVRPQLGRLFSPEEAVKGGPRVMLLSYALWQNKFGGDSSVLNRSFMMNGFPRTVVGIMPPSFSFPQDAQYWTPLIVPSDPNIEYNFQVLARLRDGVTAESAQRELMQYTAGIDATRNEYTRGSVPVVMTLHERLFGSVRKPLTILLASVVVLLLIACANVANLTLARSATRQREFAVRLALGAGRWRLVRQLLVESTILATIGGALGLLVPHSLVGAFVKLSPSSVARVSDIGIDGSVLLFTVAMIVASALLFGLAPALTGARSGPSSALGSGSARATSNRAQRTVRASLVVFEVAAALTLLTGATLLTKSFAQAMSVSPGFVPDNVYSANFHLPAARYASEEAKEIFFNRVITQLRSAPGVEAVSSSDVAPLKGYSYTRKMSSSVDDPAQIDIAFAKVDSAYGRAMHLNLRSGRFIDATDLKGSTPVAMLTVSAANHLFPGQNAVGKTIPRQKKDGADETYQTVVGVVDDVAQRSLDQKPVPQVFLSAAQVEGVEEAILVRANVDAATMRTIFKQAVQLADPLQPLTGFSVLREDVAKSIAPRRFNSLLINAFAGMALVLAMVGLYGLMAHAVASRTRELGIRIALGAQTQSVVNLVLRQGLNLVLLGIVAGVAVSFVLSRTIASLLYDVPAQDPLAFVGAPMVLAVVALIACYVPARRATKVDPTSALRQE